MRYFIILSLMLSLAASASSFLDADYAFIDSAFDGMRTVTNKEFNDTINKMTPKPVDNTFWGKTKTFLFGRQYGVEPQHKEDLSDVDLGGEQKAIQDLKKGVYYIRLTASIVGKGGNVIPLGNYKIQQKIIDDTPMLVFYQGQKEYGMLKLSHFNDTLKGEHDIAYSRVDIVSDDVIRIVYATFDDTKCSYARVFNPN